MEEKELEKRIEKVLQQAPDFHLPPHFADNLIKVIEESRRQERKWEMLWIGFASFLFLVAFVVVIVLTGFKPSLSEISFLSSHAGLIIFGVLFILGLHFMDKKFIHKAQSQ